MEHEDTVTAEDLTGIVHTVAVDDTVTYCGTGGLVPRRTGAGPVTCLTCTTTRLYHCPHPDAVVHNCPYAADVHDNHDARCRCCDSCARNCADDV